MRLKDEDVGLYEEGLTEGENSIGSDKTFL